MTHKKPIYVLCKQPLCILKIFEKTLVAFVKNFSFPKIVTFSKYISVKRDRKKTNNKFITSQSFLSSMMSYRRVPKKKATNYCTGVRFARYGPQSVSQREWLMGVRCTREGAVEEGREEGGIRLAEGSFDSRGRGVIIITRKYYRRLNRVSCFGAFAKATHHF